MSDIGCKLLPLVEELEVAVRQHMSNVYVATNATLLRSSMGERGSRVQALESN
ncbi:hypothetical protein SAMN04487914_12226 [Arthrobacter sp. ok909]|nr:hypothetical protein SAMN04487914_12226 [Arthrobacter sp. ok909]